MWHKIVTFLFQTIGLPLILSLVEKIKTWWSRKQAVKQIETEIDESIEKIEQAPTEEEQKNAFKEFIKGIRRRRSSK